MLVHQYLGQAKPRYTGPVLGIELEIEGRNLPHALLTKGWTPVRDGSLRDGLEYVLTKPVAHEGLVKLTEKLFAEFDQAGAVTDYSFRTSTHVHLNVLDMEAQHVLNLIYMVCLMEPLMMKCVAEHRRGNRFCLGFRDSEALMSKFSTLITGFERIGNINEDEYKYAALNLATLLKYGTLEFRTLEGTRDLEKIAAWTQLIVNLRQIAQNYESIEKVHEQFVADPERLVDDIFPNYFHRTVKDRDWKHMVEESYSLSYHLVLISQGAL